MNNKITLDKWLPQKDSYCIFYNENSKGFRVSKFKEISELDTHKGFFGDIRGNYFKFCEPFVGNVQTKTFIKNPEEGEFYMFYNNLSKGFRISKFKQIATGKPKAGKYKDYQGNYFDYCCEYDGILPFYLNLN